MIEIIRHERKNDSPWQMTFLLSFPKDLIIRVKVKLRNSGTGQNSYRKGIPTVRRLVSTESCVAYVGLTSSSFLIDSDAKSFWMVELEWRFQVYGWASVNWFFRTNSAGNPQVDPLEIWGPKNPSKLWQWSLEQKIWRQSQNRISESKKQEKGFSTIERAGWLVNGEDNRSGLASANRFVESNSIELRIESRGKWIYTNDVQYYSTEFWWQWQESDIAGAAISEPR